MGNPRYYFVENKTRKKFPLTPENVKSDAVIVRTLTKEETPKLLEFTKRS